ncbi:hypothetical protein PHIM1EF22_0860 [Enterococcus phage phiM1EF22]|nr:hypothetical protein PHIM1EF22_0860 [Enterococcus phage phiM1EF22]
MVENLREVNYKTLTLEESLHALLEGKTLIVKGLEQRRKLDVLVRIFSEGVVPVTQISYDTTPADGYWRTGYWQIYDLPINALSTYPCFIYDDLNTDELPKFMIGDTVYYTSKEDSIKDSAIVISVYKDDVNNKWHYKLSRDNEIYAESEIRRDRL